MKTTPALPKSGMKSKNGQNNLSLLAGLLFIFITAGFSIGRSFPAKKMHGVWQYKAIYKNSVSILSPDKNDTMLIDTKKSIFHYSIKSLNKNIGGTFQCLSSPLDSSPYQKTLMFQYQPSNSVRRFHIMLLHDDSLIIREGNTYFHYSKRKP